MIKLSVNINKIATIRNARGGDVPNVVDAALACERFGADGITVHPRPDERHITAKDVKDLSEVVSTEFNIEGYPDERYLELVAMARPTQATLVPDPPEVLTSNAGWDVRDRQEFLRETVQQLKEFGCRVSIFLDPDPDLVEAANKTGADRIELYTEAYAKNYGVDREAAIANYVACAKAASELGLEINAGHDLSQENLEFFASTVPGLKEVSIGHALISDSLYYGLENAIGMYKRKLVKT